MYYLSVNGWSNKAGVYAVHIECPLGDAEPISVEEYIYEGVWGDQLTSTTKYTVSGGVLCSPVTQTYAYDASGNPIGYQGATLSWEGKRLVGIDESGTANDATFTYDENGMRTKKVRGTNTTQYYYNGSLLMGMNYDDWAYMRFSYDSGGQVVSVNYYDTDYYYVRNGQGDIIKLIDGNGSTVVEYKYDTWGKIVSQTGDYNIGYLNPFRYRGYVYDEATGWYYLQSRYYDPEVGRFLNADALLSTGQGVLGYNMYAYCLNNPVNMADSNGLCSVFVIKWKDCKSTSCRTSRCYTPPSDFIPCNDRNTLCAGYVLSYIYGAVGKPLPETLKGRQYSSGLTYADFTTDFNVDSVTTSMIGTIDYHSEDEGLGVTAREITDLADLGDNELLIAVRVKPSGFALSPSDYHFAIRLKDGTWADKRGQTKAREGVITQDMKKWPGGYSSPIRYIAVSVG